MPVPMEGYWKKRKFWKKERRTLYNRAYEEEKFKQLKRKREQREKEIAKKAQEAAYRKYGMTKKEKVADKLTRFQKGVEKARKAVEFIQKDLENDMRNEGFY